MSAIEGVRLPSTLKRIEPQTFAGYGNIRSIQIPSGVEYVGEDNWYNISEVTLPSTLKEIDEDLIKSVKPWGTIWVEDGCTIDVKKYVDYTVTVLPAKADNKFLRDLRQEKNVVIPDGTQCIGTKWFEHSEIESVRIPASVTEIQSDAFHGCGNLEEVTFEAGSKLKTI